MNEYSVLCWAHDWKVQGIPELMEFNFKMFLTCTDFAESCFIEESFENCEMWLLYVATLR